VLQVKSRWGNRQAVRRHGNRPVAPVGRPAQRLIAISCTACGYTDLFNPEILEGKDNAGGILDAIFGG